MDQALFIVIIILGQGGLLAWFLKQRIDALKSALDMAKQTRDELDLMKSTYKDAFFDVFEQVKKYKELVEEIQKMRLVQHEEISKEEHNAFSKELDVRRKTIEDLTNKLSKLETIAAWISDKDRLEYSSETPQHI